MNLVVNSNGCKIEDIDGEIMSTNGRVKIFGNDIPPYPKLLHLSNIDKKMIAQNKINGYNVRLAFIPELNSFIAVLRGGYVCAKTTFFLRKHFSGLFMKFFEENKKKILCLEVVGRKSLANLHSEYFEREYGFCEIGYFVFDIMDLERGEEKRFLPFGELEKICKKYNLGMIHVVGVFENIGQINSAMQSLPDVFEGMVLKSMDGGEILKYKFEDRPDLFPERIRKREVREIPPEERIVAHFFQGYEERELGLESGISQEEMDKYGKMVDEMRNIILKDKTKTGEESGKIANFLLECIKKHGKFDGETLKKMEKLFRNKVGGEVGKILKFEKRMQ